MFIDNHMRTISGCVTALILSCAGWAFQAPLPAIHPHPPIELDLKTAPDPAWQAMDDAWHVSFASTDVAYERHKIPGIRGETRSWSGIAWRGERVHTQVLVWSKAPLGQLRLVPSALAGTNGRSIPASAIRARFVRYVLSERPLGSRNVDCGEIKQDAAYLVPDLLDPIGRLDVPGSTTRPIWITIDVPRDAVPGAYSGNAELRAAGGLSTSLSLKLDVQGGTVPPPADWSLRVDFWQNPWAVARQHRVEPWGAAHLSILREHLKMLADMGQTYVSAYITDSPWHDDTYVPDGTMVEWIREPDGSFHFDYRVFNTYVELAMAAGIKNGISCFTLVPWEGRIRYLDRVSGEYRWEKWATDSAGYAAFWKSFLADLRGHLNRKGWFSKTYLEVNERSLEDTMRAIKIAREDSAGWKITYAGNYHAELSEPVDDLCTVLGSETPAAEILKRRERRQTSTFYNCCAPPFPNDFPFSPPAENVWIGWHAAATGMDGFLRWAWDSWPADPLLDSRHIRFPAGDTFLAYPGPMASVRMERLREGFVDFEKIRILRRRLAELGSDEAKDALRKLDGALGSFSWERALDTSGQRIIEDLGAARATLVSATRTAFPSP